MKWKCALAENVDHFKIKLLLRSRFLWKIPELGCKNAMFQSSMGADVSHSLPFPLAWASKPNRPYLGRSIVVSPKESGCPGKIQMCRRDPERHKLPWGNAIALPNQRFCFLSQFLFYILFFSEKIEVFCDKFCLPPPGLFFFLSTATATLSN